MIQWFIGGRNVTMEAISQLPQRNEDKFRSSSELLYTGNNADHEEVIYCEAIMVEGRINVKSAETKIIIVYGPKSIMLSPSNSTYILREHASIGSINCSADCRPDCQYNWTGPNGYILRQLQFYIESLKRNQSGIYKCYGFNQYGNIISTNITVTINYQPSIDNLDILGNTTIMENETAVFQCDVDSYPKSNITWKNINKGTVIQKNPSVLQSYYNISKAQCADTGTYQCEAANVIDDNVFDAIRQINFSVLCSPRLVYQTPPLQTTIGVKTDGKLNITVSLLAFPAPKIKWTFNSSNTGIVSNLNASNTYNKFTHISRVLKVNISQDDLGIYTMFAYNGIVSNYTQAFTVISQRQPDPPTNISVYCGIMSISVFWKSEFNGGDTQLFYVIWRDASTNNQQCSSQIPDPIETMYGSYSIGQLSPNTLYTVTVQANNSFGKAISEERNCTTKTGPTVENNSTSIIGGVTGTACALLLIILGVGIFFVRRRFVKGLEDNGRIMMTETTKDDNDDDCLKDNVLYESAGPYVKSLARGDQYAVVERKGSRLGKTKNENINETALYSDVTKSTSKPQKGAVYANIAKTNNEGKCRKRQQFKGNEVYENSEDKEFEGHSSNSSKDSAHKDGLQYADLIFNHSQNGGRFIIHGLEDRTIYAEVDTTQKIDPLPDDDIDDKK